MMVPTGIGSPWAVAQAAWRALIAIIPHASCTHHPLGSHAMNDAPDRSHAPPQAPSRVSDSMTRVEGCLAQWGEARAGILPEISAVEMGKRLSRSGFRHTLRLIHRNRNILVIPITAQKSSASTINKVRSMLISASCSCCVLQDPRT